MSEPRLVAELVPASTWGWNLRSLLSKKGWDDLRQSVYARAGFVCEICGGKGRKHPVEAHERWEYNDSRHVQKLVGLEALCPSCHEVRHIGRALSVGRGHLALMHLGKVNQWTPDQVEAHVEQAMRQWNMRSRSPWKLNLAWLETLPAEFRLKSAEE